MRKPHPSLPFGTPTAHFMTAAVRLFFVLLCLMATLPSGAQRFNEMNDNDFTTRQRNKGDSIGGGHTEAPRGLKVWTVDPRFGDRIEAVPDTMSEMYMNTIFTTGLYGQYNTTGNLGAARQNRIFTEREADGKFLFTQPYDYFITKVGDYHFTNTYSPITNLSLNTCGNRTNGEDHFKAFFAVNAGKRFGMGFKFDYLYGRGYYDNNSSSLFDYSMHASYLGDRYQAHVLFSTNHQKQAENGGITDDNYITHPEIFGDDYRNEEIPTMLSDNWNRNDNQHVFLTHRYSFGFNRKVPMTEEEIKARKFAIESQKENEAKKAREAAMKKAEKEGLEWDEEAYQREVKMQQQLNASPTDSVPADSLWLKNEYVPVTSFIHTLQFDNFSRIYQAYSTPKDYYANNFNTVSKLTGDSIYDKTLHYNLRNTFAVALLEGFNKYAKAGLKAFLAHDLAHFTLPDTASLEDTYNEHTLSVGGQLTKREGTALHYDAVVEVGVAGKDAGKLLLDATADLNFRLGRDTVQFAASGFLHRTLPTFYYRHYHARHFWWDDDELERETHSRVQGHFQLKRFGTRLTVGVDNLSNYTYFANSYDVNADQYRLNNSATVRQYDGNVNVLTAQLAQRLHIGPVHIDLMATYQKSSKEEILPLPTVNLYGNVFLRFLIAHVLKCDLGADVRYFTKYKAPDFVPGLAQYAVQENAASQVELGNYPIVNAYANFHLQHTRFFVMMSHVNATAGNYFFTPHYPLNDRILRFGVSWNFFN